MKWFALVAFAFITLSTACSEKPHANLVKKERIRLEFPANATLKNWSICSVKNSEWITCLRSDSAAILFFAIQGGNPVFQIPLKNNDSLQTDMRVGGYVALSPDSIFVLLAETSTILLVNRKGEISKKYEVNIPLHGIVSKYCFVSTSSSPMICDGKNIYVTATRLDITVRDKISRQNYFTLFPEVAIPIHGSTPKSHRGSWPSCYTKGDSYRDFYPQRCFLKNTLVYGFAATDSLYCLNSSVALTTRTPFELLEKKVNPYPDDSLGNFSFLERYDVTESRYLSFFADPFRSYYYRIYQQGILYEQADGMTVNEWLDKPWKLLIMDEEMKAVGAVDFDQKKYFPMALVSQKGILVRDRKKEANATSWDIYTFQEP
jgi:hypothetical protein